MTDVRLWTVDGKPDLYLDETHEHWLAEKYGIEYWEEYDRQAGEGIFNFPWPSLYGLGSSLWPEDTVEELEPTAVRGIPVRHLLQSGTMTLEDSYSGGDEVAPEREVDYEVHLYLDAQHRPRRIDFAMDIWGTAVPLAMEFWDLNGDFVITEPDGLHDGPPQRPITGPIGTTSFIVQADFDPTDGVITTTDLGTFVVNDDGTIESPHADKLRRRIPTSTQIVPTDPDVTFDVRATPSAQQPGQIDAIIHHQEFGTWRITILPTNGATLITTGDLPLAENILDHDPGEATVDLPGTLPSCKFDAEREPRLTVQEIEYDDYGPNRLRVSFKFHCAASGHTPAAVITGELSYNALSG
ncbi:MAG: hypothetical protein GY926_00025 [bacterium]|nr:hypothetical protein [bacterium]